jgi:hypothetical protein
VASGPRIIVVTGHWMGRLTVPAWMAAALLLGMAAIFAPVRAWGQAWVALSTRPRRWRSGKLACRQT